MDFHFALSKCFFHGAADGSGKVILFVPMPVGLQDWRAGIANALVQYSVTPPGKFKYFSSGLMIAWFYIFLYIYLFVALSVIAIPVTILKISVISHFSYPYVGYIFVFFIWCSANDTLQRTQNIRRYLDSSSNDSLFRQILNGPFFRFLLSRPAYQSTTYTQGAFPESIIWCLAYSFGNFISWSTVQLELLKHIALEGWRYFA